MSLEVVAAVLGEERMKSLTREQIQELARVLDAEILRDPELTKRLSAVIESAASQVIDQRKASS